MHQKVPINNANAVFFIYLFFCFLFVCLFVCKLILFVCFHTLLWQELFAYFLLLVLNNFSSKLIAQCFHGVCESMTITHCSNCWQELFAFYISCYLYSICSASVKSKFRITVANIIPFWFIVLWKIIIQWRMTYFTLLCPCTYINNPTRTWCSIANCLRPFFWSITCLVTCIKHHHHIYLIQHAIRRLYMVNVFACIFFCMHSISIFFAFNCH